jgi:glycosyltransferase involved in cell wall biosynthesis
MVELKGQRYLIEAVPILKKILGDESDEEFELHFFGSGPSEGQLVDQARGLPKNCATFHGQQSDLERVYGSIDVLVVTSESEGLSMVIIEAMARGIPTIATQVGGNPSLVLPDRTGILVPYADPQALAEAMHRFLQERHLLASFGEAARQLVSESFSIEKTYQSYFELYKD